MTLRPVPASDTADLDALAAIEQLRAVQREIRRLQAEVESVADRLWLTRGSVVWSGAAADTWRATMAELLADSSRGAQALGALHTRVEEVADGIAPGWT